MIVQWAHFGQPQTKLSYMYIELEQTLYAMTFCDCRYNLGTGTAQSLREIVIQNDLYNLGTGTAQSDRKSTRLNSSHVRTSRMPSSA